MITRKKVLILGAGASMPFKFPSGWDLVQAICTGLNNSVSKMSKVLQPHFQFDLLNTFQAALAASRQPSVDLFLEFRPEFLEVGKAAIAAALIPHEQIQRLIPKTRTWYDYLWDALRCPREKFHENQLGVITYNYDRSLEQFLQMTLQHSYGVGDDDAMKLRAHIPVIHVHGSLGELTTGGRAYTHDLTTETVIPSAKSIRVIHEEITEPYEAARKLIDDAEVICFLGFGYNETNVKRLCVREWKQNVALWGTTFGLTTAEWSGIHTTRLGARPFTPGSETQDVLSFLRERALLP